MLLLTTLGLNTAWAQDSAVTEAEVPAADATEDSTEPTEVTTRGDLRLVATMPTDFVVDSDGTTVGEGMTLDSRARLGTEVRIGTSALNIEADLLDAILVGDPWDLGDIDERNLGAKGVLDRRAYTLRKANVSGLVGPVMLTAGFDVSHWGMGMLANDGAHDNLFGRTDLADRVFRVRGATRTKGSVPVTLVFAGDRIVADDIARWDQGQSAYQLVGAAMVGEAGRNAGVYGVFRTQREADPRRITRVGVVDATGVYSSGIGGLEFVAQAEAATIFGNTSRSLTYNERDALKVRSGGAAAQLDLIFDAATLTVRSGVASGDANAYDDVSNDFAFDRNFGAGIVMFPRYQAALDVQAYNQLSDPHHTGQTPDGLEAIVTEGGIRRASFIQPVVRIQPDIPLEFRLGAVVGWATAPIAQPFESHRAGGVPTNHLGKPTTGQHLGTEVDWAAEFTSPKNLKSTQSSLLVQGGHYFASDDLGGASAHLVSATGRVRW
ncbi:MAG: hypothetical protein GY913_35115 [Proteobacteria bacterium]|nr:hypothetical protein [Pseudomonadota bacterium]MCP4922161.1 hypothetical protein [Pseudomonadota bacterium]